MIRKTVSLDEGLFEQLEVEGVLDRFKNFSELVSAALHQTIESVRQEGYRRQIEQMAEDPMVIEDIAQVQRDYRHAEGDWNAF